MKITFIQPSIGHIPGKNYIRSWQMEPLPIAQIVALTPKEVETVFWDDRMEVIPYDEPTDLVALSVETYTAKRAYQIASEYRRRGVPVVMGGFHPTLCSEEVSQFAESVVIGEAEKIWSVLIDDFCRGEMKRFYYGESCDHEDYIIPDRSVFKGKKYLKIGLLEAGRGCKFQCEFCSIQKVFKRRHSYRNINMVVEEINQIKDQYRLLFFIDDNICADSDYAKDLFRALIPLKIKWVGQADISMTYNDDMLDLIAKSGCQGILVGFESLNTENLKKMNKGFNSIKGGPSAAISKIHKKGIRLYATFIFGYEKDSMKEFDNISNFCKKNKFFLVGFNHCTPFPGTDLYQRLEKEKRLLYNEWWLDDHYKYGQVPFKTSINPEVIEIACIRSRRQFYSIPSIFYRLTNRANVGSIFMLKNFIFINFLMRKEAIQRIKYPLGDLSFQGDLLKIRAEY